MIPYILSAFTGVAISLTGANILDQGRTSTCVVHAISTCRSYIGINQSTGTLSNIMRAGIAPDGGMYDDFTVNYLHGYTNLSGVMKSLDRGVPVIGFLSGFQRTNKGILKTVSIKGNKHTINVSNPFLKKGSGISHAVCIVGYNKYGLVFQNSHGREFGVNGFGVVRWKDLDGNRWINISNSTHSVE